MIKDIFEIDDFFKGINDFDMILMGELKEKLDFISKIF